MTCRSIGRRVIPTLLLVAAALAPSHAQAHRLNVFGFVEGTELKVEAFFSDGKAARKAEVTVYGADGELLAEGKTDAKGECAFELPAAAGDLKIVATSGAEHRGEYTLKAEHYEALASLDVPVIVQRDAAEGGGEEPAPEKTNASELDEIRVSLARIDATLRIMQRQVAELRKPRAGVSLESIMAGIGFIVGLTGIAMYFMARNERKKAHNAGPRSSRG